jgi:hypothetical protein
LKFGKAPEKTARDVCVEVLVSQQFDHGASPSHWHAP